MYYEVSYGITSEIYGASDYSCRYPHRKRFASQEDIEKWCGEMEAKYGEPGTGWILGDENVHEGELPKPRSTKSLYEIHLEQERKIAVIGEAWENGREDFSAEDGRLLDIYLHRRRRRARR